MGNEIHLVLRRQEDKAVSRICVVSLPLSIGTQGLKRLKGLSFKMRLQIDIPEPPLSRVSCEVTTFLFSSFSFILI